MCIIGIKVWKLIKNEEMNANYFLERYKRIWDDFSASELDEILGRGFTFQFDNIENPDILFMGINPSYLEKEVPKVYTIGDGHMYPYHRAFKDVSIEVKRFVGHDVVHTHMDVMVLRETNKPSNQIMNFD